MRPGWRSGRSGCSIGASDAPNRLSGVVVQRSYAGETLTHLVRLADGSVMRATTALAAGTRMRRRSASATRVTLSWQPDACIVLHADERRTRGTARPGRPLGVAAAVLLILPALIVLKIALSYPADSVPPYAPMLQSDGLHVSTDAFALILSDPLYARALLLSLKVAGLSTAICLLAGYPMALAIARSPERWRSLLLMLVMLPFWTGFLMRINAWIGLLQDDGWINTIVVALGLSPLRLLYTDTAMYIGIVYTYLPFMVLPLYARLSQLDVRLLEAAADLGAPPWRVFLAVTLPLSLPGVWAGMLLVFIPAAGEYVIPDLLGGPQAQLIGRVLWQEFFQNSDWPTASAIACALLVLLLLLPAAIVLAGHADSLHLRQPLLRHRAPRRIRRRFGQSAAEQRRRFLGDAALRLGDRLGCFRGDRRIEPHGKRGAPGIGRLLQPAAARFGIAEQDVALVRLLAVRIESRRAAGEAARSAWPPALPARARRRSDRRAASAGSPGEPPARYSANAPIGTTSSAISTGARELVRGPASAPPAAASSRRCTSSTALACSAAAMRPSARSRSSSASCARCSAIAASCRPRAAAVRRSDSASGASAIAASRAMASQITTSADRPDAVVPHR